MNLVKHTYEMKEADKLVRVSECIFITLYAIHVQHILCLKSNEG